MHALARNKPWGRHRIYNATFVLFQFVLGTIFFACNTATVAVVFSRDRFPSGPASSAADVFLNSNNAAKVMQVVFFLSSVSTDGLLVSILMSDADKV
jgi:hypothetical protein